MMRILNVDRNFDLSKCKSGNHCATVNGYSVKFLFMSNGTAPLVMEIGGSGMENYTVEGKHLFDPRLDLVMEDAINVNQISATNPMRYEQIEADFERADFYGQRQDMRKIHTSYLLY